MLRNEERNDAADERRSESLLLEPNAGESHVMASWRWHGRMATTTGSRPTYVARSSTTTSYVASSYVAST